MWYQVFQLCVCFRGQHAQYTLRNCKAILDVYVEPIYPIGLGLIFSYFLMLNFIIYWASCLIIWSLIIGRFKYMGFSAVWCIGCGSSNIRVRWRRTA